MLAMLLTRLDVWQPPAETGGLIDEVAGVAYQYYKGKRYTLQEAARLRELDNVQEVLEEPRDEVEVLNNVDTSVDTSYDTLLNDIRSRQQTLKEIQLLRRELEVSSTLKKFEAEELGRKEELLKLEIKSTQEERELLLALMMLI